MLKKPPYLRINNHFNNRLCTHCKNDLPNGPSWSRSLSLITVCASIKKPRPVVVSPVYFSKSVVISPVHISTSVIISSISTTATVSTVKPTT